MYYDIICTLSLDIKKRRIYWLEFCCPKNTYILYQLGFLLHYNYTYFDYKQTLVHLTYLYTYKTYTYNTCIILYKLSSQSVFLLKLSFYLDDEDDDKNDDFVSPSSNKWMSDLILFLIFCWTWFTSSLDLLCEDREYILFFNSCGLVREYPFPDYDASNCWSIIWWFFSDFRRTMTFHWTVIVALNTWSLGAGSMPVLVQLFPCFS